MSKGQIPNFSLACVNNFGFCRLVTVRRSISVLCGFRQLHIESQLIITRRNITAKPKLSLIFSFIRITLVTLGQNRGSLLPAFFPCLFWLHGCGMPSGGFLEKKIKAIDLPFWKGVQTAILLLLLDFLTSVFCIETHQGHITFCFTCYKMDNLSY